MRFNVTPCSLFSLDPSKSSHRSIYCIWPKKRLLINSVSPLESSALDLCLYISCEVSRLQYPSLVFSSPWDLPSSSIDCPYRFYRTVSSYHSKMAATTSIMTFAPHQPSPLARTISPFKDPRTPPNTPGKTAKLWDEYERRAVENARKREGSLARAQQTRTSASDLPRTSATFITSARSSFDFKFRGKNTTSSSTQMAICKTCKEPITYASGICERCKKTNILSPTSRESTPPLSPAARNFAPADLPELNRKLSREDNTTPKATSPKRMSFCPMPTQMLDPPIRLDSLRPPPNQNVHMDASRSRKTSLTDPNEPFLRIQVASNSHLPSSASQPTTPTYPPTTPPSTPHSRTSTRPSSLTNTASPLSPAVHIPTHSYARQNSIAPSDSSTLYPHTSRTVSINTHAASAWDDWDSDGEGKKSGFMWKGISKPATNKGKKKERSDSNTSDDSISAKLSFAREEERKKNREQRRSGNIGDCAKKAKSKRREGLIRVFSCGGIDRD